MFRDTDPGQEVSSNCTFEQKINKYDEDRTLTEEWLVVLAENKYKTIIRSGEWRSPNEYQKEVLALRAQVEVFKKKQDACQNMNMGWNEKPPSDTNAKNTRKNRSTLGVKSMQCEQYKESEIPE